MSSFMVDFIISLDGYGAAGGWPGYWGMEGPEYLAWIQHDAEHEHTALMGATTYRLMSGCAAEMPDEPGLAALTATPKVVFSSTWRRQSRGPTVSWSAGDPVETVQDMKRRDSRPLRTIGSLSLCRSLLEAGVVDRFRVVVFPVSTGATGRNRTFDGYPDIALDLVDSRTFDGRLQLLEYVPTVLDGPPGVGDQTYRSPAWTEWFGMVRCRSVQRLDGRDSHRVLGGLPHVTDPVSPTSWPPGERRVRTTVSAAALSTDPG